MLRIRRLGKSLHHRAWVKTVRPRIVSGLQLLGAGLLRVEARHLHGPRTLRPGPDELVATCVVRNGALHVRSFVEHHQAMGIRHLVFLDNASTDATVDLLREYEGVTVFRTRLPYRWLENQMKGLLVRRFCTGRWNLCLDIDELWGYPFMARRPLSSFLAYLDDNGFDTVVCQMLDLFSDIPLSELESRPEDDLRQKYRYYDLDSIEKGPYPYGHLSSPEVRMHFGGIRARVFGTRNWLTKAALVRVSPDMRLFVDTHFNEPARVADVTCVLMHFPFVAHFPAKVAEAVSSARYLQSAQHEYEKYQQTLDSNRDPTFLGPTTLRFTSVDDLVEQGFLVASERFRAWAHS